MMKKRERAVMLLAILIIASILISGCGGTPKPLNVFVGKEGVAINFIDNLPPAEVYENTFLPVSIQVWNKGAYSLNTTNDYAVISFSFDSLYFRSDEGYVPVLEPYYLQGKSLAWPEGERDFIEIARLNVTKIKGTRETPTTTIQAFICYPYNTVLSETVCIDADIYGTETNPLCTNQKTYSYPSGQGAPVVISSIESDMLPAGLATGLPEGQAPVTDDQGHLIGLKQSTDSTKAINIQPTFTIFVTNPGKGLVFVNDLSKSVKDVCELISPKDKNDLDVVEIKAKLGGKDLTCEPTRIKLFNGEGRARCYVPRDNIYAVNRNYKDVLNVKLDYIYLDNIQKQIKINRLT